MEPSKWRRIMRDETGDADRLFRAYALLGLSPSASASEVKTAYRRAAREHHHDKGGDRAKFEAIIKADRDIAAHAGTTLHLRSLGRSRVFRFLIAPRIAGFLIAPGDPIDGRSRLVRVTRAVLEGPELVATGADGEVYRLPHTGNGIPTRQSLCLQGLGEPGRRGGVAGDLLLWFS